MLEAYYHFLFVLAVLLVIKNKFLPAAGLMVLLSLSHLYSSTEIILIIFTWASLEYFYLRSGTVSKKNYLIICATLLFQILYYGLLMRMPVYKAISQHVSLDWGYKAWHFIPAYFIVWLLSFIAVRNIPLLKKQFSSPVNRLFFCWGMVAFLLSVHGFAIKPIQPLHFTRGYVYAGFFLFAVPAIVALLDHVRSKKSYLLKVVAAIAVLIFLSDNILWFYFTCNKNGTGIYLNSQNRDHFQ